MLTIKSIEPWMILLDSRPGAARSRDSRHALHGAI